MNICDHTPDISRGVRRLPSRRILDAIEVVDGGAVEIERISLIERVNFAAWRYRDIGMSEHELSKRGIECVAVDTITSREDEVRRRAIHSRERSDVVYPLEVFGGEAPHCIAGSNHFTTRPQDVCNCAMRIRSLQFKKQAKRIVCAVSEQEDPHDLIYSKNCADVYTGVDVAASIKWVEDDAVLSLVSVFDDDGLIEFFRHKHGGLSGRA